MSTGCRARADELLHQLEKCLIQRGDLILSYDNDLNAINHNTGILARESEISTLPPSLSIYPSLSLDDHLRQHAADMEVHKRLEMTLASMMRDTGTVEEATAVPIEEAKDDDIPIADAHASSLPELLVDLRTKQRDRRNATEETFTRSVVTCIDQCDGSAEHITKYVLPAATSWKQLQRSLQEMTISWQARQAGFADGYSLQDGKWMYQICRQGLQPGKSLYDLTSVDKYKKICRVFKHTGVSLLVWHELLWRKSEELRQKYEESCHVVCKDMDDEPRNEDGSLIFDPTFDLNAHFAGEVDLLMSRECAKPNGLQDVGKEGAKAMGKRNRREDRIGGSIAKMCRRTL